MYPLDLFLDDYVTAERARQLQRDAEAGRRARLARAAAQRGAARRRRADAARNALLTQATWADFWRALLPPLLTR